MGTLQGPRAPLASMRGWKGIRVEDYAAAIKAVGAQHCILSSDLGQAGNPMHTDGLRTFITALKQQGISDHEIDLMARKNPHSLGDSPRLTAPVSEGNDSATIVTMSPCARTRSRR
ncbi:MAG: hypothetical protein ACE5MK_03810, partial [Acidobacteriota bacterium]